MAGAENGREEFSLDLKNRAFTFKSYYGAIIMMALILVGLYVYSTETQVKEMKSDHRLISDRLLAIEKHSADMVRLTTEKLEAHKALNSAVTETNNQLSRLNAVLYMRLGKQDDPLRDYPR